MCHSWGAPRPTGMPRTRIPAALLIAVLATACHARPTPVPAPAVAPALVVYARLPGARFAPGDSVPLTVLVRQADDPRVSVQGAAVVVHPAGATAAGPTAIGAYSDSTGHASFATLPPGEYRLLVRRIGYAAHTVPLTLPSGCPVAVEVYLGMQFTCLFQCPAMPAHVTVTTCAPKAD
jgi:Carboxypeptidase regulatory-like domain